MIVTMVHGVGASEYSESPPKSAPHTVPTTHIHTAHPYLRRVVLQVLRLPNQLGQQPQVPLLVHLHALQEAAAVGYGVGWCILCIYICMCIYVRPSHPRIYARTHLCTSSGVAIG